MTDILAQSLASLANARNAVLEEMKNRYPVGSEVSWRAGKGFSTGHVIGHAPFWTREPTRLQVKPIRNGKVRWVTPYNIPFASYAAPPAQGIDLGQFREAVVFQRDSFKLYAEYTDKPEYNRIIKKCEHLLALIDKRDAAPGVWS